MGQRSYLYLPFGEYEINNNLAIGWFFLFEKNDFKVHYGRSFHPKGDEWEWPDEEEAGEEQCELGYLTTAGKGLENLETRTARINSQYLKEFLSCLKDLRTNLQRCKPTDEINVTCLEYLGLWKDAMECANFIHAIPESLDQAIINPDHLKFYEIVTKMAPTLKMTGNSIDDAKYYGSIGVEIADFLLGRFWDFEKQDQTQ